MTETMLKVGDKFSTPDELSKAIESYSQSVCQNYYKRDSRKIEAARKKVKKHVNPNLVYYELTYHCIKGGIKFQSTSKGIRNSR